MSTSSDESDESFDGRDKAGAEIDDEDMDMDYHGQLNLAKLKSLRHTTNWEIETERHEFLRRLYPLVKDWKGPLPDLRDMFRPEEIDWLLAESVKSGHYHDELTPLVKFVINTGYKDKPDFDKYGMPLFRRTTPIHHANNLPNAFIISDLLRIYDRFDVNYTDESGLTHLHVACRYDCDDAVKKILEFGQDPNCLWQETGDSPLHFALEYNNEEVFRLLMKAGADPNLANANGLTPLHIICLRNHDDNIVDEFFKINDDKHQKVLVDARDDNGKTPLQLAVSNLMPHVVDVLLNRGADLSNFIFPTESDFAERSEPWTDESWDDFKLRLASGALAVVENLEKRGYELDQSDALTIMKLFIKNRLFDKWADIEKCWYDKEFKEKAKEILIYPRPSFYDECDDNDEKYLSLDDLIELRPEEVEKHFITYTDYFDFWRAGDDLCFPDDKPYGACAVYLCEKLSRTFFRRWTLNPLLELTCYRLPILCCDMIIKQLKNQDLWHICLAATDQNQ